MITAQHNPSAAKRSYRMLSRFWEELDYTGPLDRNGYPMHHVRHREGDIIDLLDDDPDLPRLLIGGAIAEVGDAVAAAEARAARARAAADQAAAAAAEAAEDVKAEKANVKATARAAAAQAAAAAKAATAAAEAADA